MLLESFAIYFSGEIEFEPGSIAEPIANSWDIGSVSFIIAAVGYTLLTLILLVGLNRRAADKAIPFAAGITAVWYLALLWQSQTNSVYIFNFAHFIEVLRNGAWLFVLIRALAHENSENIQTTLKQRFVFISLAATLFLIIIAGMQLVLDENSLVAVFTGKLMGYAFLILAVIGLMLTEQVLRNTLPYNLWQIKFFCLSIGSIFLFDFILYSNAAIYGNIDLGLWNARGLANVTIIPLIAIGASRAGDRPINLNLSRQFVFRGGVLLVTGLYLIAMGAASYYIQTFSGSWGEVLQTVFIFSAVVSLAVLMFSSDLRSKIFVFISKNFFPYQYDYRLEWQKLTQALSGEQEGSQDTLYERCIRTMGGILEIDGGALWLKDENNDFQLKQRLLLNYRSEHVLQKKSSLLNFLQEKSWVIDINEYRQTPNTYDSLELPEWIVENEDSAFILPLPYKTELLGIIVLPKSRALNRLNWEHYDLLKVAAQQVVSYIALDQTAQQLASAQQFQAYNQMSAFLVHDIKTMIAQLSLMVSNASVHKNNPEFIDDMIKTTDHSVKKMTHLLEQLKTGSAHQEAHISLLQVIDKLLEKHQHQKPAPSLLSCAADITLCCDEEKLQTALGHLLQNAQDATNADGTITINVELTAEGLISIQIQDTGSGMSEEFMREQLFKPFESTKGVSGMGIGVYQCREYIRAMKGDLSVSSELDLGTTFIVTLAAS